MDQFGDFISEFTHRFDQYQSQEEIALYIQIKRSKIWWHVLSLFLKREYTKQKDTVSGFDKINKLQVDILILDAQDKIWYKDCGETFNEYWRWDVKGSLFVRSSASWSWVSVCISHECSHCLVCCLWFCCHHWCLCSKMYTTGNHHQGWESEGIWIRNNNDWRVITIKAGVFMITMHDLLEFLVSFVHEESSLREKSRVPDVVVFVVSMITTWDRTDRDSDWLLCLWSSSSFPV